jgi:hypothetical protein
MKQYATRFITAVCLKASAFMFIGSKKNNQDYYTHSAYEIFRLENHDHY